MGEAEKSELTEDGRPETTPEDKQSSGDRSDAIVGILVWVAIILGAAWFFYRSERADVFLDVSKKGAISVQGIVLFHGDPVKSGQVHVVVEDAKNKRYLASAVLPVSASGTFNSQNKNPLPEDAVSIGSLKVAARYLGTYGDKEKKALSGESVVYLNGPPPLGTRTVWATIAILLLLMIVLIILFTGELARRKARMLFGVTYFITFISLALPIAITLLVAQNRYLVEMMEGAPIGLIKGIAKGVSDPQWLVNIGGSVRKSAPEIKPTNPSVTEEETSSGTPAQSSSASPAGNLPAGRSAAETSKEPASTGIVTVEGGLAIPFYVVILATLGAAINMTRSVPEVQRAYDDEVPPSGEKSFLLATLKAPSKFFSGSEYSSDEKQRKAASKIRKGLIENYMYVLSAPFLAIAVYYLLQVIAKDVAEPVLVLMAFATGLVSDKIIKKISDLAGKTLGLGEPGGKEEKKKDETPEVPEEEAVRGQGGPEPSGAE